MSNGNDDWNGNGDGNDDWNGNGDGNDDWNGNGDGDESGNGNGEFVVGGRPERSETVRFGTEEETMRRVRAVADLLDGAFEVPGTGYKVGLDPILGIVPVGGDAAAMAISLYIVLEGANLGLPPRTLAKMLGIVAVDAVIGSVPVLGTVFDAVWKANQWNVSIIEDHVSST